MPSGAKKRKAAKKKQVSSTNPLHDDNTLDPLVEVVEKREDSSSENKSKEESSIDIKIRSKSKSSSSSSSDSSDEQDKVVEKKVVVESTPVIETISPTIDSITPTESVSDVKKDLIVEKTQKETETEEKQKVVDSEICLKDDLPASSVAVESVLKENEEKLTLEPKEEFAAVSVAVNDSVSEVRGADCVDETETVEHSERQTHPAASIPLAAQNTTSWKSCCGIFELFSGSGR